MSDRFKKLSILGALAIGGAIAAALWLTPRGTGRYMLSAPGNGIVVLDTKTGTLWVEEVGRWRKSELGGIFTTVNGDF